MKWTDPLRRIPWGVPFGRGLAVVPVETTMIRLELVHIVIVGFVAGLLGEPVPPGREAKPGDHPS